MKHHLPQVPHLYRLAAGRAGVEMPPLVSEIPAGILSYNWRSYSVALRHTRSSINFR
jgi:hypothetical protein